MRRREICLTADRHLDSHAPGAARDGTTLCTVRYRDTRKARGILRGEGVVGGGGDLVASLSGVKRFFFKKLSFHQRHSEERREAAI